MGFSHKWGFSGVTVINLFAWRSQDPGELRKVEDPVGPRNNYWLKKLFFIRPMNFQPEETMVPTKFFVLTIRLLAH